MTARRASVEAFEVSGDGAMAWYFVMAHWPNAETAPQLQCGPGPMQILVEATHENLFVLRCLLTGATKNFGTLAQSSRLLLLELAPKLPDEPPRSETEARRA
jgi:hypothetical protein